MELSRTYDWLYQIREPNESEKRMFQKWHSDVCMNFYEISSSYLANEEKLAKAAKRNEELVRRIKGALAPLKHATDEGVAGESSVFDMRDFAREALLQLQEGEPFYGAGKGYRVECYNTQEEMEDQITAITEGKETAEKKLRVAVEALELAKEFVSDPDGHIGINSMTLEYRPLLTTEEKLRKEIAKVQRQKEAAKKVQEALSSLTIK